MKLRNLLSSNDILMLWILLLLGCASEQPAESIALDELTIAEIHAAFRANTYNAVDLTQAYLDRINAQDSAINSISNINPDALSIALELDKEFKETGELRPLHGIPVIVKDNINTSGLPTTAGSLALKDFIPQNNAPIIRQLIEAGAIILAKSNMAEWAFSPMHTESSTHGTTRNPYNLNHVPAGSSGGTAAAVAANLGTVGLGTDTGNSIRGPSAHCSLVGFRTTLGLISRSGIVPLFLRNDVVGPMCRTVEDATRVMEVMVGPDPTDPITAYAEDKRQTNYRQYLDPEGLHGARIGVLQPLVEDVHPEIQTLFDQALQDLDSLGATMVSSVQVPNFEALAADQWCATFRSNLENYLAEHVAEDSLQTLEDIIEVGTQSAFAKLRLDGFTKLQGRWGNAEEPCGDAYQDARRLAFRKAIEYTMDSLKLDALIYPSWNYPPARIEHFQEEYKGDNSQIVSPHTGQPAFTVPMGFVDGNLPAGLQFLGRMFDEPTLIRLTYAYEQGTKHREKP